MNHPVRRLEEEMRTLVQAHRALQIDIATQDTLRRTMMNQTAREIWETHTALKVLWPRGIRCGLSVDQLREIGRITDGIGLDNNGAQA